MSEVMQWFIGSVAFLSAARSEVIYINDKSNLMMDFVHFIIGLVWLALGLFCVVEMALSA